MDRSEETPVLLPGTTVGPEIIGEILPSGFYPRLRAPELTQALKASFGNVSGLRDCSSTVPLVDSTGNRRHNEVVVGR